MIDQEIDLSKIDKNIIYLKWYIKKAEAKIDASIYFRKGEIRAFIPSPLYDLGLLIRNIDKVLY